MQFDLRELFSYKGKYRKIKVKADQIDEIKEYNDGSLIMDPSRVGVPVLNALFLIKEQFTNN
jgi:hypothetical protein